jgi:hypothetical protein
MTKQRIARTKKAFPKMSVWRAVLTAIVLALPMRAYTQEAQAPSNAPTKEAPRAPGTAAQPGPVMEQRALDELKRMSAALGAAKALTCKSRSFVEVTAAKTGQFMTLIGNSEVALQRPNKLRVHVTGEVPNFDFYYDGTNVVAYAPQNKVYSVASAPDNIDGMLQVVEEKTGIHFPSADFMGSDPYAMLGKDVTNAFVVGTATLDGVACEHLAFMNPGTHWQVWIDAGKSALPQRLAVTYADVQNFPRFLVEFSDWNLQPKLADSDFVFKKPDDAKQIAFPSQTGRQKGR